MRAGIPIIFLILAWSTILEFIVPFVLMTVGAGTIVGESKIVGAPFDAVSPSHDYTNDNTTTTA